MNSKQIQEIHKERTKQWKRKTKAAQSRQVPVALRGKEEVVYVSPRRVMERTQRIITQSVDDCSEYDEQSAGDGFIRLLTFPACT